MAHQNKQYIQGPQMDWTEDAGLHQRFKDWREEVELLIDTVLSHIKNADTKLKFVTLWAGKEARTYLNTLKQDNRDSLSRLFWTVLRNGPDQNPMRLQPSHISEH